LWERNRAWGNEENRIKIRIKIRIKTKIRIKNMIMNRKEELHKL